MSKKHSKKQGADPEEMVVLGTFHEWNGKYYIDISVDAKYDLDNTVIHETRHMLVRFLRKEKIINLEKWTEEIAYNASAGYNQMFNGGIYELREQQKIKK